MKPYKVRLRLTEDDATGEWGLCPSNAINVDNPFNSFWSHQGIFHDVFEHYFEDNSPYFYGSTAFNLGGEVAAMGHLSYYWSEFYLANRRLIPSSIYSFEDSIRSTTEGDMLEGIKYGYTNYGDELKCVVPYQKPGNSALEDIIENHWNQVKEAEWRGNGYEDENEKEAAIRYKKSITKGKLQRLYRWGYHTAEKIAPYSYENRDTLDEFMKFWKRFTDMNDPKELSRYLSEIEFTVYPGKSLKWEAEWITQEGHRIEGKTLYPEELILEFENY
jgi:hypothetical protein